MSRHGFFDLIPLPSEPLPLCRLCPEFRSLPTVPMGTGAIALILSHETYLPVDALVLLYADIVK
jgi:hypothetical protein